MIHVYRYQWIGLNIERINSHIDPMFPASLLSVGPRPLIDLSADDSTKEDLDAAMVSLGWSYHSTDPATSPQGLILRQETNDRVLADLSTNSNLWVDLLSVNMTTDGGWLTVIGAATTECAGDLGYLRTTINGIPIVSSVSEIGTSNKFLAGRVPVPQGTYTLKLQWRVDGAGVQHVRPVSKPEAEFANLIVRDVSA